MKDISDYVEAGLLDREGLDRLCDDAETYVGHAIAEIGGLRGARRDDAVRDLLPDLALLDSFAYNQAKERLAKFGFPKRSIEELVQAHRSATEAGEESSGQRLLEGLAADFHPFFPAMDFHKGQMYLGVNLPVEKFVDGGKEIDVKQYLVTSSHEAFPLDRQTLFRRGLAADLSKTAEFMCPWSYTGEFGSMGWISGKTPTDKLDPVKIYDEVRRAYSEYLWFPTEGYHDVLALFTISTFFTPIFDSVPYLYFNATKTAGKSTAMDIMSALAFNAVKSEKPTLASLYRLPEMSRGLLLLDDIRKIASQKNEENDELFGLLKGGYKRSGKAILVMGDAGKQRVGSFSTFCPKVFSNTTKMDSELAARAITLFFRQNKNTGLPQFLMTSEAGRLFELRNKLYCLALESAPRIAELYKQWKPRVREGLSARDNEVWVAIFVIALWLDDVSGRIDRGESAEMLLGKMIELAISNKSERESQDAEEDEASKILSAAWEFVNNSDAPPHRVKSHVSNGAAPWVTHDHYFYEDFVHWLMQQEGFEYHEKMTYSGFANRVGRILKTLGFSEKPDQKYYKCTRVSTNEWMQPGSIKRRVCCLAKTSILEIADQRSVTLAVPDESDERGKIDDAGASPEINNPLKGRKNENLF